MKIHMAKNKNEWDNFLISQSWSPFLQSWTMGEVYREIGQEPIRLEMREGNTLIGICQAILVPARRGRHLMIQYGPALAESGKQEAISNLIQELKKIAKERRCSFIRISPFWPKEEHYKLLTTNYKLFVAPMHLLAEHIWFLSLKEKTEEEIFKGMRATTRNLIRRAEKEGVEIMASPNPLRDLPEFLKLHDQTRRRHHFTPYTNAFFTAQVKHFAESCSLYLASYQGNTIAASIHIYFGGETSYHHGASSFQYSKISASYLLQWRAIQDAIKRGDHIYNFWGISPHNVKKHPFKGVTTFKTGFGGELLELTTCMDIPLSTRYYFTRTFELLRKWKRGF